MVLLSVRFKYRLQKVLLIYFPLYLVLNNKFRYHGAILSRNPPFHPFIFLTQGQEVQPGCNLFNQRVAREQQPSESVGRKLYFYLQAKNIRNIKK